MHRRTRMALGLAALLALPAMVALPGFAQSLVWRPGPSVPLDRPLVAMPLRGGAYVVQGGVGNTGFVIGDTGVVAIDAQMFAETAAKELAEIAKITPKPVRDVILTHSDQDHVGGLPAFPQGIGVIAQENARTEIQAALNHEGPIENPPPARLKDYLPTHVIRRSETMVLDGVRVVLTHLAAAHTDGDLVIYLPAQKIVYTGDLVTLDNPRNPTAGPYPIIYPPKHGSSLGWIKVMKAMLALDADIFVSGHGAPRQTRASLRAALAATEARRAEIKRLFDQGRSLSEIKAALHDAGPVGGAGPRFPTFIETTYQELLQE